MSRRLPRVLAVLLAVALFSALGTAPVVAAAKDRSAPTAPTNLRVLPVTPYPVTPPWDAPEAANFALRQEETFRSNLFTECGVAVDTMKRSARVSPRSSVITELRL